MFGFRKKNDPFSDHERRNRNRRRGSRISSKSVIDGQSARVLEAAGSSGGTVGKKWDKQKAIRAIIDGPSAWASYRADFPDLPLLYLRDINFADVFRQLPRQAYVPFSREYWNGTDANEDDEERVIAIRSEVFPLLGDSTEDDSEKVYLTTFEDYDFSQVDFSGGQFEKIAFLNCKLDQAQFVGATTSKCYFVPSDICKNVWFDRARLDTSIFQMQLKSPDFYRTIFRNVDFASPIQGGSFLWCSFFSSAYFGEIEELPRDNEAEEDGALASEIDNYFRRAVFYDCSSHPVEGVGLSFRGLRGAQFDDCSMPNTQFSREVKDVDFSKTDLPKSSFKRAALSKVRFSFSNIRMADFSDATLDDVNFTKVIYRRRELEGKFQNIHDASGIYGDLISQQDLRDQVFIDSLQVDVSELEKRSDQRLAEAEKRGSRLDNNEQRRGRRRSSGGLSLDWLKTTFDWQSGATVGGVAALFGAIIGHYDGWSWGIVAAVALIALAAAYINTPRGQRSVVLAVWRQLDYGRDWDRVLVAAFFAIGIFGVVYHFAAPELLCFSAKPGVPAGLACDAVGLNSEQGFSFYPWYIAVMGFATLGLVDLVEIRSALGAMIVILNVLAGFITLGLLLAVVSRSFTRRG